MIINIAEGKVTIIVLKKDIILIKIMGIIMIVMKVEIIMKAEIIKTKMGRNIALSKAIKSNIKIKSNR